MRPRRAPRREYAADPADVRARTSVSPRRHTSGSPRPDGHPAIQWAFRPLIPRPVRGCAADAAATSATSGGRHHRAGGADRDWAIALLLTPGQPTAGGGPSTSRPPLPASLPPRQSSQAAPAGPTEAQLSQAVTDYYALLPDDTDAGWELLTPSYQRQTGGRRSYEDFWNDIDTVRVSTVRATLPDRVQATIRYVAKSGNRDVDRTPVLPAGPLRRGSAPDRPVVGGLTPPEPRWSAGHRDRGAPVRRPAQNPAARQGTRRGRVTQPFGFVSIAADRLPYGPTSFADDDRRPSTAAEMRRPTRWISPPRSRR